MTDAPPDTATVTQANYVPVPRTVIRELRLAEADYERGKPGAVERLSPALDAILEYENASVPSSPVQGQTDALREAIARIDAQLTPGPWDVWRERTDSRDDAVAELMEQVQSSEPFAGAVFLLNAGGKCPATTGCGPTSEANANSLAELRNLLPEPQPSGDAS